MAFILVMPVLECAWEIWNLASAIQKKNGVLVQTEGGVRFCRGGLYNRY